ncbi:alpha-L-fucosidase [Mucilaginibacter sp. P25]|uniref:Alpha-L-fucosidase n=2 Tax=Mucilaginibacter TaxID=423349 RepID=A0A1G8C0C8_9SPHI|nr:alpha-L-fucosidase [Mucilaginibacter gossypii]
MITNLKKIFALSFVLSGMSLMLRGQELSVNNGPFKPSDTSFKQYQYPAWFRDAKFGIWAHWGPQAVPPPG